MPQVSPDVRSYNYGLVAWARAGDTRQARNLLATMRARGVAPNKVLLLAPACFRGPTVQR